MQAARGPDLAACADLTAGHVIVHRFGNDGFRSHHTVGIGALTGFVELLLCKLAGKHQRCRRRYQKERDLQRQGCVQHGCHHGNQTAGSKPDRHQTHGCSLRNGKADCQRQPQNRRNLFHSEPPFRVCFLLILSYHKVGVYAMFKFVIFLTLSVCFGWNRTAGKSSLRFSRFFAVFRDNLKGMGKTAFSGRLLYIDKFLHLAYTVWDCLCIFRQSGCKDTIIL